MYQTTSPAMGVNHVAETLDFVLGKYNKAEYAELIGVHPPRLSNKLLDYFIRAIQHLQGKNDELTKTVSDLQFAVSHSADGVSEKKGLVSQLTKAVSEKEVLREEITLLVSEKEEIVSRLTASVSQVEDERDTLTKSVSALTKNVSDLQNDLQGRELLCNSLQSSADEARKNYNRITEEARLMKAKLQEVQAAHDEMQSKYDAWNADPFMLKILSGSGALVAMMYFLAVFEMVGVFNLLYYTLEKHIFLALCASLGMGFAVLIFTARRQWAGVAFALIVAGVIGCFFFGVADPKHSNWLFAFTPMLLALILVVSKIKKVK